VVLAAKRQWSQATPYAGSLLVHVVVAVAVNWVLFRPIVVRYQSTIDVEVIDPKDFPKAVELPNAVPRPSAVSGTVSDATRPSEAGPADKTTEPPIYKPQEVGNGWFRSRTIFSEAEISDPKHKSLRAKLGQLESGTRTTQICDLEAILQITRSGLQYHPEGVVAYAMADVVRKGELLVANGAAFQSDGNWYNLSFRCRVSSRSQMVQGFEFAIGTAIRREDWESHGLPAHPVGLAED
jgi:hypothetical protein